MMEDPHPHRSDAQQAAFYAGALALVIAAIALVLSLVGCVQPGGV